MKKRKIIVLSATVLLAIAAFPSLSSAVTGGPPTRDSISYVMGQSGCQMNLQFDPNGNVTSASVSPAFAPPPVFACPPNQYCYLEEYDGAYYCPDLNAYDPFQDPTCTNPSWSCYHNGDSHQEDCSWWGGIDPYYCGPTDFHPLPNYCSPPVPAPIVTAPTVNAAASLCSGLTVEDGNVTDSWVYKDCPTVPTESGLVINCSLGVAVGQRLAVEKEVMEELAGSCTYRTPLPGGTTKITTFQCTMLGWAESNGCTCGVSDGCKTGAKTTRTGVYCP